MPKLVSRLSAQELNNTVISFHNHMLAFHLINSGTSWPQDKRNEFAQKTFDLAYTILSDAFNKKDICLFNRIYSEAKRLVPWPDVTPDMAKIRDDFDEKTIVFVQEFKVCVANGYRSR